MNAEKILKQILNRLERLEKAVFENDREKAREPKIRNAKLTKLTEDDFNKPIRPFIKKYAKGMSGPKKFTLLLTRLVKGDLKKSINLVEIKGRWSRMTGKPLLGMKFNRFYPSQAKDKDWVESKKKGEYNLRPTWKDIFI